LRQYVLEFQGIYDDLDIQLPDVTVGPPVNVRASHLGTPTRIIDEAIASVKAKDMDFATTA
jgi:hypothetical protein